MTRPCTIRNSAFLDTVFDLPVTLCSTYLHRCFVSLNLYWQVQVRITLCNSFHALIRIELQDKTKLVNSDSLSSRLNDVECWEGFGRGQVKHTFK